MTLFACKLCAHSPLKLTLKIEIKFMVRLTNFSFSCFQKNADPIHHALLKHLFVGSCEPYCGFIKSWIFRASIDDPYREFFVHKSTKSNAASESVDKLFLTEIKVLSSCFFSATT